MKPIELDLNDVNDPDYTGLSLWIGKTALSDQTIEVSIQGLIHMQPENLQCTISKEDAINLAKTILENIKD